MANIIIMNSILPEPTSVGTTKTTFNLPEGTITRVNPPSTEASDYTVTLANETFTCNFFQDGDTKIKAAYRVDGHDSIAIELIKATGEVIINIRHDEHTAQAGMVIKLVCTVEKVDEIVKAIVRFNKDKAVMVTYNKTADTLEYEEV